MDARGRGKKAVSKEKGKRIVQTGEEGTGRERKEKEEVESKDKGERRKY